MQKQVFAMAVLALVAIHARADDMFLKLDSIDGESTDARHRKEIVVTSYALDVRNPPIHSGGGGGSTAGRPIFADFRFSAATSTASPKLLEALASGRRIREAVLSARSHGGNAQFEYLKVTFSDVVVTGFEQSGSAGGRPAESTSFTYGRIRMEYTPQNANGSPGAVVQTCWDVATNAAC